MRTTVIILLIISYSCGLRTSDKVDSPEVHFESKARGVKIFKEDDEIILNKLKTILNSNPQTQKDFENQGLILNLYCDTLTCAIDSITPENGEDFKEFSNEVVKYFESFRQVECYDNEYHQRISQYDILLADYGSGLFYKIDYGYRLD